MYQCLQLGCPLHYPKNSDGLWRSRRSRVGPEFSSKLDGLVCGQNSGFEKEMRGILVEQVLVSDGGKIVVKSEDFIFFSLRWRWGCREHFVSGCWHCPGRDRGRYPRECWLSTLGVLHPGVPVRWYGHIRDLSPTAKGCMGGRTPNVTLLHWAQQRYALVGSDGWVIGRLVGQGLRHQSYHTLMHTTQHQRTFLFPSLAL